MREITFATGELAPFCTSITTSGPSELTLTPPLANPSQEATALSTVFLLLLYTVQRRDCRLSHIVYVRTKQASGRLAIARLKSVANQ